MKKKTTYKQIAGIIYCLLLFICSGCIHQDLPACDDDDDETCMRFNFIYDYNMQETDLFAEQVDHITLIIYTETGQLEQIVEYHRQDMEENHTVSLMLSPGNYIAVAWGNIHTEHYRLYNHETTAAQQLEMACIDNNYTMTRANPGSLFHGSTPFEVIAGHEYTQPVKMIKNSNQIKVVIRGLTQEDQQKAEEYFQLRLISTNWKYNFNNTISTEQPVTYLTERHEEWDNHDPDDITAAFMFYPLRLFTDDYDTVLSLRYRNTQTGREAALEKPLVPYLLNQSGRNTTFTPAISDDDEYLNRQDNYEVTFVIGADMHGNIYIKEWEGINQPGDL